MNTFLEEFITGERFQKLADVSIIPEGNEAGESNCDFVIQQQTNNDYKVFYYNSNTNTIPEYVQNARTIFVNNWTLEKFFSKIFPLLKNKYVFISHNSDASFTEKYAEFLNSDKVLRWYSQNTSLVHDKLFSLPIGIANQQYPHGDLGLLDSVINASYNKEYLVYKNFDMYTNYQVRSYINHVTTQNNIFMSARSDQPSYLSSLAKSFFCISPPGNGVDCHRVWECLYLKTVPVIKKDVCYHHFSHLPILFIDDWNQVTTELLKSQTHNFQTNLKKILPELNMSYWRSQIYEQ